jgi:hypothetical protein
MVGLESFGYGWVHGMGLPLLIFRLFLYTCSMLHGGYQWLSARFSVLELVFVAGNRLGAGVALLWLADGSLEQFSVAF